MLRLMWRKSFSYEFRCQWNCHLRYATRVPIKAERNDDLKDEHLSKIQSIAVPVNAVPTIDVSKRVLTSPSIPISVSKASNDEKKTERLPWNITPSENNNDLLNNYMKLSKFRLTSLVVITSMAGYAMAPAAFDFATFAMCSLGTGLVSGAANAINQYHEVPFDSQMSRTKNRVLVTGKVTPAHAVGFALVSATTGLSILYFGVNGLTAALGAGNLILYTSIYTPMKRFSILNTWIGSVVGAIPPLMGWAGCAGHLDAGAWILAGLLYAWQFPHFNALSWNLRPDYSRAGYRMMAVTNPGLCRRTALRYTVAISALTCAAPAFDVTNIWFALESLPLNAYFTYLAWKFYKNSDSGSSRKLFRFSLIHLPALMILFLFNKKRWIFIEEKEIPAAAAIALADASPTPTSIDQRKIEAIKNSNVLPTTNSSISKVLPVAVAAPSISLSSVGPSS